MPVKSLATFSVSRLDVLKPSGRADPAFEPNLSAKEHQYLLKSMILSRELDKKMVNMQRQGRMGTFPPSTGHEATICGSAMALHDDDWLVGYYRESGARLMRGASMVNFMRYWTGFEEGNCPGEMERRVLPIAAIIASHVPHAVGVAHAMKIKGDPSAVLCIFGDGATSQGDLHESMNFAAVWKLPIVFLCMNNQWAISHPVSAQTASETLVQKCVGYGMPGLQVDGNDVLAVYHAVNAALAQAKSGAGPSFIEAITYRLLVHTTSDDPKRYRSDEEVESWWKKDPIIRYQTYLKKKKVVGDSDLKLILKNCQQEVLLAVQTLENESTSELKPDVAFDNVFGVSFPEIERQRKEFLNNLEYRDEQSLGTSEGGSRA